MSTTEYSVKYCVNAQVGEFSLAIIRIMHHWSEWDEGKECCFNEDFCLIMSTCVHRKLESNELHLLKVL